MLGDTFGAIFRRTRRDAEAEAVRRTLALALEQHTSRRRAAADPADQGVIDLAALERDDDPRRPLFPAAGQQDAD